MKSVEFNQYELPKGTETEIVASRGNQNLGNKFGGITLQWLLNNAVGTILYGTLPSKIYNVPEGYTFVYGEYLFYGPLVHITGVDQHSTNFKKMFDKMDDANPDLVEMVSFPLCAIRSVRTEPSNNSYRQTDKRTQYNYFVVHQNPYFGLTVKIERKQMFTREVQSVMAPNYTRFIVSLADYYGSSNFLQQEIFDQLSKDMMINLFSVYLSGVSGITPESIYILENDIVILPHGTARAENFIEDDIEEGRTFFYFSSALSPAFLSHWETYIEDNLSNIIDDCNEFFETKDAESLLELLNNSRNIQEVGTYDENWVDQWEKFVEVSEPKPVSIIPVNVADRSRTVYSRTTGAAGRAGRQGRRQEVSPLILPDLERLYGMVTIDDNVDVDYYQTVYEPKVYHPSVLKIKFTNLTDTKKSRRRDMTEREKIFPSQKTRKGYYTRPVAVDEDGKPYKSLYTEKNMAKIIDASCLKADRISGMMAAAELWRGIELRIPSLLTTLFNQIALSSIEYIQDRDLVHTIVLDTGDWRRRTDLWEKHIEEGSGTIRSISHIEVFSMVNAICSEDVDISIGAINHFNRYSNVEDVLLEHEEIDILYEAIIDLHTYRIGNKTIIDQFFIETVKVGNEIKVSGDDPTIIKLGVLLYVIIDNVGRTLDAFRDEDNVDQILSRYYNLSGKSYIYLPYAVLATYVHYTRARRARVAKREKGRTNPLYVLFGLFNIFVGKYMAVNPFDELFGATNMNLIILTYLLSLSLNPASVSSHRYPIEDVIDVREDGDLDYKFPEDILSMI